MDKIHDFEVKPKSFGKANANENINVESTDDRISMPPPTFQLKASNLGGEAEEKEEKVTTEPTYQLAAEGSEPPSDSTSPPNDDGATPNKPNNTGLPTQLKSGVENLSGFSLDDVNVHFNSSKPAQLQAHAYAQGSDIHLGPGQERHLPHEAWHVVQQKQGRVQATTQMKGIGINDDSGLEKEADVMGAKAMQFCKPSTFQLNTARTGNTVQRLWNSKIGKTSANGKYMIEKGNPEILYGKTDANSPKPSSLYINSQDILKTKLKRENIQKWEPNVRLFPMSEHLDQANKQKNIDNKEQQIDSGLENGAGMGILGDNDCLAFAKTLHTLIKDEVPDEELQEGETYPGTWLKRGYPKEFEGCDFHSVTTVANDGNSIITLEAHAGKDIHRPEFNIYNGKEGFFEDETPDEFKDNYAAWGSMDEKGPQENLQDPMEKDEMKDIYTRGENWRMIQTGLKERDQ